MRRPQCIKLLTALVTLLLVAAMGMYNWLDRPMSEAGQEGSSSAVLQEAPLAALVERGAYLARLGNCLGCHTAQGGAPYAGGRAIKTPFGVVYASNLTSDPLEGLGAWSAAEFWQALHNGRSKDGRLLYPAFPYTSYTWVTREDSDAIFAYLRSVPPVAQVNQPHALRFPYDSQVALAAWRTLFFRPQRWEYEAGRSVEWNRGAYLVRSLGHCAACHTPRNALGASRERRTLGGGMIAGQDWYAPALDDPSQAGMQNWTVEEIVALLRTGSAPRGAVSGPMAEVVARSTQYLDEADARAMAVYLRELPVHPPSVSSESVAPAQAMLQRGWAVYDRHCAQCHGSAGKGVDGAFPPLAGNRAVLLEAPVNMIRVVLAGGFLPATGGNSRPHGMPPFLHVLSDDEVADVLTFVRNAWGNRAPAVGTIDVYRAREGRSP